MDTFKKAKALWHGTGKLIAAHYNQKHYGGNGTEAVVIHQLGDWYGSEHRPHAPFNNDQPLSQQQQAASLAYYSYGSILLAIQQVDQLPVFFNPIKGIGRGDCLTVIDLTIDIGIPPAQVKGVFDCMEAYVQSIRWKEEFKPLFEIPTTSLLRSDEDEFTIDLARHTRRITPFLNKHEAYYQGYVASLQLAIVHALTMTPSPCVKLKR